MFTRYIASIFLCSAAYPGLVWAASTEPESQKRPPASSFVPETGSSLAASEVVLTDGDFGCGEVSSCDAGTSLRPELTETSITHDTPNSYSSKLANAKTLDELMVSVLESDTTSNQSHSTEPFHQSAPSLNDLMEENEQLAQITDAEDPLGEQLKKRRDETNRTSETKRDEPIFEIGLPLLMDRRYLGDVTVQVSGDTVKVATDSFLKLLKPDLTSAALDTLRQTDLGGYIVIGTFLIEGVDIAYNPEDQQIEVTTPIEFRERRTLRVGVTEPTANIDIEKPGDVSLFVNTLASIGYDWDKRLGPDKLQDIQGAIDLGGRFFGENGIAFLSRHNFSTSDGFTLRRDETVFTYDMPDRLLRASMGDLRYRGQGFQSAPLLAGLSVERFFDLEPNRLFRPVGDAEFELDRPSTVEVRVNGVTQQEIILPVGRFSLEDLPLSQGSNLLELVVRDDLGRERIITDRNFFDFALLEQGISDFSLTAGVKSQFSRSGNISYSDDIAASGFIRRGITNNLTLGLDVQGDETGGNIGGSALFASAVGVIGAELALSDYERSGSGLASEISYRILGGARSDTSWSLSGSAQYTSAHFNTLDPAGNSVIRVNAADGVSVDTDSTLEEVRPVSWRFLASGRLTRDRFNASLTASHSLGRGLRLNRTSVIGGVNYRITPRLSAGLFGRYVDSGLETETALLAQVNWRIGRNRDIRTNYDTGRNEITTRYTRTSQRGIGALSYAVNGQANLDTDQSSVAGSANYVGNRFEATLDHSLLQTPTLEDGSETSQFTRASIGTSLVFVDGEFGLGRPVDNNFVILDTHKTLNGKTVLINPTENGASGKSDLLGSAVVTEGQSFAVRSTYFDVEDLPIGYDLGDGQFSTKPPLYAGYKVEIGSAGSFTVLGNIVSEETGKPVAYVGGKVESLDRPEVEDIQAFSNRNGRLAATGLAPGEYRLTIFASPNFVKTFVIEDGSEALIDLGTIRVEASP